MAFSLVAIDPIGLNYEITLVLDRKGVGEIEGYSTANRPRQRLAMQVQDNGHNERASV